MRLLSYLFFIGIMAYVGTEFTNVGVKNIGVNNYAKTKLLNEI